MPAALFALSGALFVPRCGVLSLLICGSLQLLRCVRVSAATYRVFLQVVRLLCVLRSSVCLPAMMQDRYNSAVAYACCIIALPRSDVVEVRELIT